MLCNNSFVNPMQLPMLCRNSRAIALLGLVAGWLASWQADEMQVNFKFLKFIINKLLTVFNKVTVLLEQQECV